MVQDTMMGHHWVIGAIGILIVIGLLLGVAALVKHLFFSGSR